MSADVQRTPLAIPWEQILDRMPWVFKPKQPPKPGAAAESSPGAANVERLLRGRFPPGVVGKAIVEDKTLLEASEGFGREISTYADGDGMLYGVRWKIAKPETGSALPKLSLALETISLQKIGGAETISPLYGKKDDPGAAAIQRSLLFTAVRRSKFLLSYYVHSSLFCNAHAVRWYPSDASTRLASLAIHYQERALPSLLVDFAVEDGFKMQQADVIYPMLWVYLPSSLAFALSKTGEAVEEELREWVRSMPAVSLHAADRWHARNVRAIDDRGPLGELKRQCMDEIWMALQHFYGGHASLRQVYNSRHFARSVRLVRDPAASFGASRSPLGSRAEVLGSSFRAKLELERMLRSELRMLSQVLKEMAPYMTYAGEPNNGMLVPAGGVVFREDAKQIDVKEVSAQYDPLAHVVTVDTARFDRLTGVDRNAFRDRLCEALVRAYCSSLDAGGSMGEELVDAMTDIQFVRLTHARRISQSLENDAQLEVLKEKFANESHDALKRSVGSLRQRTDESKKTPGYASAGELKQFVLARPEEETRAFTSDFSLRRAVTLAETLLAPYVQRASQDASAAHYAMKTRNAKALRYLGGKDAVLYNSTLYCYHSRKDLGFEEARGDK